jgi:eukaryotic-like serine/threonine-protein kinase
MVTDSKSLVEVLQESRLLEGRELEQAAGLQARYPDAKGFGAQLIRAGWLTPFQVNQLLQGRCADLVLGPYRILERLGEGGMGQVFKARHESMQRTVALKVIRKDKLSDPRVLARFRQEARAAAQLAHPNIVTLYDASEIGGTHFLALEYVEGCDLGQLVKEKGPLPIVQACDYVGQAALGLQHAHERGLVHRDIKPSNLVLARLHGTNAPGLIKLLDMGLARLNAGETADAHNPGLTQADAVIGTPDYMAPEQAKNSRTVDARADLYSLGCTLYYLLTGQTPFDGASAVEKLVQHQMEEAAPLRKLRPDAPAELDKVVRKLMAKRPEDRYASAAAAAEALVPFTSVHPDWAPPRAPLLRRRRVWVAAALAGLLLLGLGVFALSGSSKAEPRASEHDSSPQTTHPVDTSSGDPGRDPRSTRPRMKQDWPDWGRKKKDMPPKDMPQRDAPR